MENSEINLTDHYVELLEDVVKENKLLRRDIREQGDVLKNISSSINQISDTSADRRDAGPRSKRVRTEKVEVPQRCRRSFRKFYKQITESGDEPGGYSFDKSFDANENQLVVKAVTLEVYNDNGGQAKCTWTQEQITAAGAAYYKSRKDGYARAKKHQTETHRSVCRRQGRIRDKLQRRLKALETIERSIEIKDKVKKVLTKEYMSSDESDLSEGEDAVLTLKGYLTKKLPWERTALSKIKSDLDDHYRESLPLRSRRGLLVRSYHTVPSSRPHPTNYPSWAARATAPLAHSTPK